MILLLGLGLVAVWAYYLTSRRDYYKLAKIIPGPPGYPVVGTALEFLKDASATLKIISKLIDEYGDRILLWFGPRPVVLLNNAEDIEKLCTSTELIDKSQEYDLAGWLGKGLVTSKGTLWAHRRKLITPCFHFAVLEKFVGPINKQVSVLCEILRNEFCKSAEFKDILPHIQRCTMDAICETSMGQNVNAQDVNNASANVYTYALARLGQLFYERFHRPWLHNNFLWSLTKLGKEDKECCDALQQTTDKVIEERKKIMEKAGNNSVSNIEDEDDILKGKVKRPLLDLLLEVQKEDPQSINDVGLRDEIATFIFAGHDTVATAVSFCLYALGNNPHVMEKVTSELTSVFGTDKTRSVTSADLKRLKYLELCFKETMRLYPAVPHIGREVTTPFRLDDKTVVPVGAAINIFPFALHRNPKYWPNPTKFIPERFDSENTEHGKTTRSPFCYIPFSAGSRNCIGQRLAMIKAKIILAMVLRNFSIVPEKTEEELEVVAEIVLRATGGLNVKLNEL